MHSSTAADRPRRIGGPARQERGIEHVRSGGGRVADPDCVRAGHRWYPVTAPIRLIPRLPDDTNYNGVLGSISRFITTPDRPVLAVVELETVSLVQDVATGFRIPRVGIRAIELSCRSVSETTLRELLDAARRERIGFKETLPFDATDIPQGER